jgi:hypothetical protein
MQPFSELEFLIKIFPSYFPLFASAKEMEKNVKTYVLPSTVRVLGLFFNYRGLSVVKISGNIIMSE